ncbi:hypothetical protein D3C76_1610920 [compost metagenome]
MNTQRKDSSTSTKLKTASTITPKARRMPRPLASAGTMEKMCCQSGTLYRERSRRLARKVKLSGRSEMLLNMGQAARAM